MGLYRYTHLGFGIAAAIIDTIFTILQGLNHVQHYVDNIRVTVGGDDECIYNLEEVLCSQ